MRLYSWLIILTLSTIPATSWASNVLRKIEVSGSVVHFSFDREIDQSQVALDFGSHDIELTFDGTLVHPAKNIQVKHGPVNQVFAYQHSPKAVRCRLNLNGNGEDYRERIDLKTQGNRLRLTFFELPVSQKENPSFVPQTPIEETSPKHAEMVSPSVLTSSAGIDQKKVSDSEKALEEKIVKSEELNPIPSVQLPNQNSASETTPVIKPLPSISSVLLKLFFVTLLVVAVAGILKVLRSYSHRFNVPWLKSLQSFSQTHLGQDGQSVKVMSTHFIGPKKSLLTVRVSGQTLLLGVTDHSIQLLTRLDSLSVQDDHPAQTEVSFEDALSSESESGIRSRIRSRLEGLKPL